MLYKGSFASLNNHLYEVRIVTNNDESQQMEITMAGEPVILSTKSDGLFSPVKSRGCTISIISSSYHFDMYNPSNQGVSVTIYDHYYSYIVFRGYVTPCVYSQEYLNDVDEIQLECIDALSTLKNIPYTKEDQQYKIRSFRYLINKCLSAAGYNDYEFPTNLTVPNMSGNPLDILGVDEENFFDDDKDRSPWSLYEVLEEISKFFCVICTPYHNKIQFVSYPCVARDFNTYRNASDSTITLKKDYAVTKDEYRAAGAQIDLTEVYNKLSLSCNEYPIRETEKDVFDKENRAGYNETKLISRVVYDDKETEEWNLAWEQDISSSLSGLTGLDFRQKGTNFYTMWYKQHGNCYDTHWYRPQSGFTTSTTIRAVEIDVGPKPYFMFPYDNEAATTTSPFTQMGFSLTWGGNGPLLTSNQYQMIGALPFRQSIVSFDTAKDEFGDTPSYSNALMFSLGKATTQNESMYDINLPLYTWHTGKKIYTPQEGYRTYIVIDGSINFVHNKLWSQYRHFPYTFNDLEKKEIKDFGDDYLAHIPLFYYDLTVGSAKWSDGSNRVSFPDGTTVDHEYDSQSGWKTFNAIYPKLMYSKTTQKYELNSDINFDCTSDYRLGLSGKGYAIPITPEDVDVNGEIVLTIYKPFIASSAIVRRVAGVSGSYSRETFGYDEDEYPHFAVIKDLKIDVITVDENFDPFKVDDEQDDDLLYELMIDPTNIVEHDTTELKINTQRPDRQPTLSAVMLNETKYLETINDAVDSEMTNSLQEWHILQHMYDHYRKPRVMLGVTVEDELPPYAKVLYPTQFPERIFVVDSQNFDLRNAQNTLQLIEYEDDENYVPSTGNTSGNTSGSTTGSTSWLDGLKVRYIYEDGTDEIVDYASEGIERDTVLTSADTRNRLYQLTEVIVGDGWTDIGDSLFERCWGLTSVTFGSGLTSIGDSAFYNCQGLTSVTLPSGLTSIGNSAFGGCTGLTSIVIPDSVTSIGNSAFNGCENLTSVTLPSGLTVIEVSTFGSCYRLQDIVIPDSVTLIDGLAFSYCKDLTSIVIPDSVTTIGDYAFSGCENLTSVILPSGLTSIRAFAFIICKSLTGITIPDSVTSIEPRVFASCWGLTSVTLGSGITSIGETAFADCYSLQSIVIPDNVTSIGDYAFEGCSGLTSLTLGSGITSIGKKAFVDCTSLSSITCHAITPPSIYGYIDSRTFQNIAKVGTLYYHAGSNFSRWLSQLGDWTGVEI